MEGDDGFAAFFGFQEGKVFRIVIEQVLSGDRCRIGVFEQVERSLEVRISVGIFFSLPGGILEDSC